MTGVARSGPGARSARQGSLGMTLGRASLDRGRCEQSWSAICSTRLVHNASRSTDDARKTRARTLADAQGRSGTLRDDRGAPFPLPLAPSRSPSRVHKCQKASVKCKNRTPERRDKVSTRERSALRIFRRGRSEWPWGAFRSTGVARNGPGARSARQGSLGMSLGRVPLDRGRSE